MNIRAIRRFGLRGVLLSSALVMFSGATTAAEIEICGPSGTPALTCEVLSLATPVAASVGVDGTSAHWHAVFENGQFLQLPAIVESLTLSLGFGSGGDSFFDFFGVAEFYLTDASGTEITADLTPGSIDIPGAGTAGADGFSRTWTGTGLEGLAIYDFHVSCNECFGDAQSFDLQAYSFTMITNSPDEANSFTIGPAAAVPAPASLALLGLGLIAVGGWSRRRHAA